jgi:hypothetical protein
LLRSTTLPFIAAAALLVSACGDDDDGGSDKVAVGDYASDICAALTDWTTAIQQRQQDLQKGLDPGSSPEDGKNALAGFLDDAVEASDGLVQDVEDAGVPDAENGQEAADALKEAAENAKSRLEESRDKVDDLPTDSPQAFASAARNFGTDVQTALQGIGEGVQDVDSDELDKAFDKESACQS